MKRHVLRAGAILAPAALILCSHTDTMAGEVSGKPKVQILGLNTPEGPGGILPYSVSNDGRLVALRRNFEGVGNRYPGYWTQETGVVRMDAPLNLQLVGATVSADGSTIVGTANGPGGGAFRWRGPGTFQTFQTASGSPVPSTRGVTADGSRFIGTFQLNGELQGYISSTDDQFISLGPSRANGVSADGGVVAGVEFLPEGSRAWYWTPDTGRQFITGLGVEANATASGVSADGSTIFGGLDLLPSRGVEVEPAGFAWSFETGLRVLSNFEESFLRPDLVASNADGSVIVGTARGGTGSGAAVWLEGSSIPINGVDYIESLGYRFPDGLIAIRITDMTDDGLTFVGTGFYKGESVGWLARVPSPASSVLLALSMIGVCKRRR